MKYLGTTFGDSGGKSHINNRSTAVTRASFGLLSAGVEGPNVDPSVVIDIYQTGVSSVLQFGCNYLKKCILNTSLSQSFFCYLLTVNNFNHGYTLVDRCKRIADNYGFHLEEYIFCDKVVSSI